MPLVRILVDAYSLLHAWPELAPGRPRHSAAAREALIAKLTQYRDASGTPVTIVFDGSRPRGVNAAENSAPEVEILYTQAGQTADQVIERAAGLFRPYGEVLAVTNDIAERETVASMGGSVMSCANFVRLVEGTLDDLGRQLNHYNAKEIGRAHV